MLKPHPESDLSFNVMVLGAELIEELRLKKRNQFVLVENLLKDFLKVDAKRTLDMFIFTLIFLYSVGIVEYNGYRVRLLLTDITQQELF